MDLAPRPIHNDKYSRQGNCAADEVKLIRRCFIHLPTPQDRKNHKHAAVSGIYAAKVGWLQRRYNSIENQDYGANETEPNRFVLTQPEPDKITATDLTQASRNKIKQGFDHFVILGPDAPTPQSTC